MPNKIDHFAIGADTLDQDVAAMEETLGVIVPRGGKHDAMSAKLSDAVWQRELFRTDCD